MRPVTNPALIAELEGDIATGGPKPVTDPKLIAQLERPTRQVGMGEAGVRGAGQGFAETGTVLGLAAAAPAMAVDWVGNLFRKKPSYAAQDFVFRNVVDPTRDAVKFYEPDATSETWDTAAKVSNVGGRIGSMVPSMIASGGAAPGVVQALPKLAAHGVRGAIVAQPSFAVPATVNRAQNLMEAGVDPATVTEASLSNWLFNTAMGAAPVSLPGGLATRMGTGAGVNVGFGAAQRGTEAAILGDENARLAQPAFGEEETMMDAGIGATMAALFGPRAAAVSRAAPSAPPPAGPDATFLADFERFRPILEANGVTDPTSVSAQMAVNALRVGEARNAERLGRPYDPVKMEPIENAQAPTPPEQLPWLQQPQAFVVDSQGRAAAGRVDGDTVVPQGVRAGNTEAGTQAGMLSAEGTRAADETAARRAFDVAEAQAGRKQAGQDEAAIQGQPRDLREARAGGTTTAEGTAATAPEQFAFFNPVIKGGQMVSGDRVEVRQEGVKMMDESGKEVDASIVRFLDREGQPEMPVPTKMVKRMERPANPRFAQDIEKTSYAPPRGVGTGEQQPQPRSAGQRITTETSPEYIPGQRVSVEEPQTRRQGEDVTDLAFDRIGGRPAAEPQGAPRQIEGPRRALPAPEVEPAPQRAPEPVRQPEPVRAEEPAPAKAAPKPSKQPNSLLSTIQKMGGISRDAIRDISGESRAGKGRKGIPPGLFRENGAGLDDLATLLRDRGFRIPDDDVDGGVQALRDMIRDEIDGRTKHYSGAVDEDAVFAAQRDARQWEGAEEARAESDFDFGFGRIMSDDEARAFWEDVKDGVQDREVEGARASAEDARDQGAAGRQDERADDAGVRQRGAQAQRPGAAEERADIQPGRDGGDGRGRDAGERGDFGLKGETPEELRAREATRQRDEAQQRRVENAPPPEDFTLTGSNRAADQAEARGQQGLFESVKEAEAIKADLNEPKPGGAQLYGGVPLDRMAEAVGKIFGKGGEWGKQWIDNWKSAADLMRSEEGGNINPRGLKLAAAAASNVVGSVDSYLRGLARATGSKAIEEIADKFAAQTGGKRAIDQTWEHGASQAYLTRMNAVEKALAGIEPESYEQLSRMIRNPGSIRKGTTLGDAALSIQKLLKEHADWLQQRGALEEPVKEGYLPRVMNTEKVLANTKGFLADARRVGQIEGEKDPTKYAEAYLNNLRMNDMGVRVDNNEFTVQPPAAGPGALKHRKLSKASEDALAKWYEDDLHMLLSRYFWSTSKRGEWSRIWGGVKEENGEKIAMPEWVRLKRQMIEEGAGDQVDRVVSAIQAATGIGDLAGRGPYSAIHSFAKTNTIFMLMEKAWFTSLTDTMMPAVRAGRPELVFKSISDTIKAAAGKGDMKALTDQAENWGFIASAAQDSIMSARMGGIPGAEKSLGARLQSKFFQGTLLHQLTNAARTAALGFGKGLINDRARAFLEGDKAAAVHLRELGVPDAKMKAFSEWVRTAGGKDVTPEKSKAAGDLGEIYRVAAGRFIDQAIMNPTRAERPSWANSGFGQTVFQLNSFIWSFHKNVLERQVRVASQMAKEAGGVEAAKAMVPSLMAMALLPVAQYGLGELREKIYGTMRKKPQSETEKMLTALSRAGLFGMFDYPINAIKGLKYERDLATTFAGPFYGTWLSGAKSIAQWAGVMNSEGTNSAERNAAKAVYDLAIEPATNAIVMAGAPGVAIPFLVSQIMGSAPVKEAFVSSVAGKDRKKQGAAVY